MSTSLSNERTVTMPEADYLRLLREMAEMKLTLERMKEVPRKMRQLLRYYGSKQRIAEWVISFFPDHDVYVEPCFGSGAVFFNKPISEIEVVSDLNGDLIHFFRMLRERPDDLIRAIMLTPYAEEEHRQAFKTVTDDDIERARLFYVRLDMGFAGTGERSGGFRRDRKKGRSICSATEFQYIEHLYQAASRLQDAQVECLDLFEQLERYNHPQTLIYLDLPYVSKTRSDGKKSSYRYEMTDEDHRAVAQAVKASQSMIIISGYASDLYQEIFGDWVCHTLETIDVNKNHQTECVWVSPNVTQARKQKPLF